MSNEDIEEIKEAEQPAQESKDGFLTTIGRIVTGRKKDSKKGAKRELTEAIIVAIVLALVIRTFVVKAFTIPSSSMENTLLIGDYLLVNKLSYGLLLPRPAMVNFMGTRVPFFETRLTPIWSDVEKGDIVVFRYPKERNTDYIKRVVAVGGDTIKVRSDVIYINEKKWETPYAVHKGSKSRGSRVIRNFGPYAVPDGKVFVMGDNRDNSYDSRWWGTVDIKDIHGRAFILYFSRNKDKDADGLVRWGRLFNLIR